MPVHFGFGRGMPRIVKTLLIVNIGTFLFTALIGRTWQSVFFRVFGLVPVLVNHRFMVWQFFTHMFLHGSLGHILINMFMLWMFGSELEHNWGSRDFLKYYLTCGIGGGLLVWVTSFLGLSSSIATTIGASGAIFGLLVAYGMMWPDRLIYIYGIFPMKALHLVLLFGAINLFYGFSGTGGSIAYFAHIGGGVTGFLYLKYGWRIMIHLESYLKRIK
ncbi:MAG TPA: rhomboid family intramembrane serine protease, partial [Anaerolineae bacterium]|nr:rhomboid family intramembrane serine protease [Anaerolineae bacterium]